MREELQRDGWSPQGARYLAQVIGMAAAGAGQAVATLDFDDTCIAGDIGDAIFHRAAERGLLDPPGRSPQEWLERAEAILDERGPGRGYAYVLEVFAGMPLARFEEHVRWTLAQELADTVGQRWLAGDSRIRVRSGIRYRRRMRRLIHRLHETRWQVWVVSGSALWAVQIAAASLGIPADRVLGQRTELEDGALTNRSVDPPVFGEGKVQVLSRVLDRPPDLAIGDSPNDRHLLGWATHGLVMDAGDTNSLAPEAASRGWAVEPVPRSWRPPIFD